MTTSSSTAGELLDRSRPLREIEALIAEAHARGEAALIRVAGPAGIGKTALLRYVLASHAGEEQTLWSAALPTDRARPGVCVQRMIAQPVSPDADESQLFAYVLAYLEQRSTVFIDDAQWLDEVSRHIIRMLAHERGDAIIFLLADRRGEAPELGPHRSVHLGPLRVSAAAQLVRRIYPQAPADVVGEIVSSASGLPFDVVFLAEQALRDAARSPDETEPSAAVAIGRRLERCSEAAREGLRHCAWLDPPVSLRSIARAMQLEVGLLAGALTETVDLAVVDDLQLVFRHTAIAHAIRTTVSDPVPYHMRLLAGLGGDDGRPEILAARLHCARACGADDVAADCALRLGRALAETASLEAAVEYLEIALRYARRPLPTAYAADYAGVLQQLQRDVEAASFLKRELDGAIARRDGLAAADLLISFFSAALTLERFAELDALRARVERMAGKDEMVACRLRTVRLAALAFSGRIEEYERLAQGVDLRWNDRRPASFVAALRGDADGARRAFESYRGELGSEHLRQEPSDRVFRATSAMFEVGLVSLQAVEDDTSGVVTRAHPTGTMLTIFRRVCDGRWDEAAMLLDRIPVWDDTYQESYGTLDVRLLHAALARREPLARHRTLAAIRRLIGNGQVRHAASPARWYALAMSACNMPVEPDIAAFIGNSLDMPPMPYSFAALPLAIARLFPSHGTERCLRALASWPRFGSRWHRAHLDLAQGLLADDHRRLRTARDAFDALGAPALAMIAGLALPVPRARDVALARRTGYTAAPASVAIALSAREHAVAELAASGLSNREIAARLGVAERTVETHLTNVYRKLRVRSRTELTTRLNA